MANRKQIVYLVPPSYYGIGGFLNNLGNGAGLGSFGKEFAKGTTAGGLLGAAGNLVGGIAGSAISGGLESGAGSAIGGLGNIASAIPGPWGAVAGAGLNVVGGLVNRAFGSKINQEAVHNIESNTGMLSAFNANDGSFDSLASTMASQPSGMMFDKSTVGKDGWFSSKAKKRYKELKAAQEEATAHVDNSIMNNMGNLVESQGQNALANFSAFGGPIDFGFMPIGGAIDYEIAQRRLDQKALEAQSSRVVTPIYALGGSMQSNGSDWSNGLILVDNGGTHEENPYEGVQMGVDENGTPNLVEEGEVVWNNYVFSNRIPLPDQVAKTLKIQGDNLTFADAARKAQKESQERPNDPISKRGLKASMTRLQSAQELIKQQQASQEESKNKYAGGGTINPYSYSKDWAGFDYYNNGKYDQGYLDFASKINQDWVNRIMAGKYGDMSRYTTKNKGINPTPTQVADLATDGKYSDMHKAMQSAYREYLAGVDPKTGKMKIDPKGLAITPLFNYTPKMPTKEDLAALSTKINPSKGQSNGAWKPEISPLENLRFAPAIGGALGVFSDLMGWTNKPDYSNADAVLEASKGMRDVRYNPIGDYMNYNPLDRLFYINQLNSHTGATRRSLLNNTGGNRGQATAGLLAADYNAQNQLGQLARQAEEYNLNQRHMVTEFNRGTNMFNSEQDLKAQIANNQNASMKMNAAFQAARLRDAIDARAGAAKSANLTNFFQAIGDIGWEAVNRDMVNNNRALYYKTFGEYKPTSPTKARGGYLTLRRRK